jgi:hypothetical protein
LPVETFSRRIFALRTFPETYNCPKDIDSKVVFPQGFFCFQDTFLEDLYLRTFFRWPFAICPHSSVIGEMFSRPKVQTENFRKNPFRKVSFGKLYLKTKEDPTGKCSPSKCPVDKH